MSPARGQERERERDRERERERERQRETERERENVIKLSIKELIDCLIEREGERERGTRKMREIRDRPVMPCAVEKRRRGERHGNSTNIKTNIGSCCTEEDGIVVLWKDWVRCTQTQAHTHTDTYRQTHTHTHTNDKEKMRHESARGVCMLSVMNAKKKKKKKSMDSSKGRSMCRRKV
jgi:hypothetical protein